MKEKIQVALVLTFLSMLFLAGCKKNNSAEISTDYSKQESWYMLPSENTHEVDTFFIYPTLYNDFSEEAYDYAPIDEETVLAGIDNIYNTQASVFGEMTNLYIPYYRQANITTQAEASAQYGDIEPALKGKKPEIDINAALDYYFEHYNEGRPFIIAGHSQGAAITRLVLKEYFKNHPEYYERMVAAYILGYSVTQKDLDDNPHLRFAEGSDDTGVIVSWNTEGEGNRNQYNLVVLEGGISINPLNWKRDETYASADENLGSFLVDEETGDMYFGDVGADAQVDISRGVIISHTEYPFITTAYGEALESIFGKESYHNSEYTLFYNNIKENVRKRIAAFSR